MLAHWDRSSSSSAYLPRIKSLLLGWTCSHDVWSAMEHAL
ncbi:unnamed protein product [Strongylus vulgaris]|uniref:Uncharacterized protein n=1 Tax=Strongylus vulgaris TaxID=40348 RepID=A0A3P7I1J0_STRVU|nr:unnamed protein product [Strongylus vulgaris]